MWSETTTLRREIRREREGTYAALLSSFPQSPRGTIRVQLSQTDLPHPVERRECEFLES